MTTQSDSPFSFARIATTILVLALIVGAIYGGYLFMDFGTLRLAKTRGRVTWKGQPVTVGAVMTEPVGDPVNAALGGFDKDGNFELDTGGVMGAKVGKHKVAIASFEPGTPVPLVPKQYTDLRTTPLVIYVSSAEDQNRFDLVLEGELPTRNPGGMRPESDGEASESPTESAEATETDATTSPAKAP